jgi:peroxiredoxin
VAWADYKHLAVQPVADFTLTDPARQRVTLSGLTAKVVVLDFFSIAAR